jgi:hypothetical protein
VYEFPIIDALNAAVGCCCGASPTGRSAGISVICAPALPETIVGDGRRIVYLVAEMAGIAHGAASSVTVRVAMERPGTLVVDVSPAGDDANEWFAFELASRIGGDLRWERSADGSGALVARIPAQASAAVIKQ